MSTLQARRRPARDIDLPTLPSVMRRLSTLLEDPDAGLHPFLGVKAEARAELLTCAGKAQAGIVS